MSSPDAARELCVESFKNKTKNNIAFNFYHSSYEFATDSYPTYASPLLYSRAPSDLRHRVGFARDRISPDHTPHAHRCTAATKLVAAESSIDIFTRTQLECLQHRHLDPRVRILVPLKQALHASNECAVLASRASNHVGPGALRSAFCRQISSRKLVDPHDFCTVEVRFTFSTSSETTA